MTMQDQREQRFTLLTNHAHILMCIASTPTMRIREMAADAGITERATQRIIAELEECGFVTHERVGRRNRYRIDSEKSSSHRMERGITVGGLSDLVEEPNMERVAS
jgi:DNA-binding MarR family transcriptional regulator